MPWSSLVIGMLGPWSQLPFSTTVPALGASSLKVTFLSGRISGETTRGPCAPARCPAAGACAGAAGACAKRVMPRPIARITIAT